MFLFEVKRLIWSALEIEFFELYFLQPVLGGHPRIKWSLSHSLRVTTSYRFDCIVLDCQLVVFFIAARAGVRQAPLGAGSLRDSSLSSCEED